MTAHKIKDYFIQEYNNISAFYCIMFMLGIMAQMGGLSPYFLSFAVPAFFLLLIKKWIALKPVCYLALFFCLGYGAMAYRQYNVHTPQIDKPLYDVDVRGVIDSVSETPDGQKLILSSVSFLNQPTSIIPTKIKFTFPNKTPILRAGNKITCHAFLRPLSPPVAPHSYNEKQSLYFEGIGAVGIIHYLIRQEQESTTLYHKLELYRQKIAQHLNKTLPTEVIQVAIPLTIGDQSVVSPYIYDIFRKSGIMHILSVSGFHLSLLVAFVFFITRFILALFPIIAENFSTKKIASVLALISAIGYIAISGMQIPAIRSLIMVMIVLIALFYNRNALSVRSWSIAVFVLLLFRPELILNISFQLSFMAVLVLVTLYTPVRAYLFPKRKLLLIERFARGIISFILVDILMMLTITPFIVYHFHQYAPYSLLGNILTGTLLSFWIMPFLFLGLITLPFSVSAFFLKPAGIGLEYVISICDKISHIPYSLILLPSFSTLALLCITLGLFCLCLMVTRLRGIGIVIISIGIGMAFLTPKPDILISNHGNAVGIWKNNRLYTSNTPRQNYIYNRWLSFYGIEKAESFDMKNIIIIQGKRLSFHHDSCYQADFCFLPVSYSPEDKVFPTDTEGTMAIYIQSDGIKIHFTNRNTTLWFPDKIRAYQ